MRGIPLAVLWVAVLGCESRSGPVALEPPVPTGIQLSTSSVTFTALGDSLRVVATVLDQHGAAMPVAQMSWTSSDQGVVLVSLGGRLYAVGNGVAAVTAAAGTLSANADVTVQQVVEDVRVSASRTTLTFIGDTIRARGGALDANDHAVDSARIAWASSDSGVLSVDSTGLVTATGSGIAQVTGTSGDASASISITVAQAPASISLSPALVTLSGPGATQLITALVTDAGGHTVQNPTLDWTTTNPHAVTVSDGLVTAVGPGSATVTAYSGVASASVAVTVLGALGG